MNRLLIFFAVVIIGVISTPAHVQDRCYSSGNGPIMSCFEGSREVIVRKPFQHKDGNYYSYNKKEKSYCFRNAYGNYRCLENWKVKMLNCNEGSNGKVYCE